MMWQHYGLIRFRHKMTFSGKIMGWIEMSTLLRLEDLHRQGYKLNRLVTYHCLEWPLFHITGSHLIHCSQREKINAALIHICHKPFYYYYFPGAALPPYCRFELLSGLQKHFLCEVCDCARIRTLPIMGPKASLITSGEVQIGFPMHRSIYT